MRTRTLLTLVVAGGLALGACGGAAATRRRRAGADGRGRCPLGCRHPRPVGRRRVDDDGRGPTRASRSRCRWRLPVSRTSQITADGVDRLRDRRLQMTHGHGSVAVAARPGQAGGALTARSRSGIVDKAMYMQVPGGCWRRAWGARRRGCRWISAPRSATSAYRGSLASRAEPTRSRASQYLAGGLVRRDRRSATTSVRGVDTTHYHASIDYARRSTAARRCRAALGQRPRPARQELGAAPTSGIDELPIARVHRCNARLAADAHGAAGPASWRLHIDMEITDFGVAVSRAGAARGRGDRPLLAARRASGSTAPAKRRVRQPAPGRLTSAPWIR